MEHLMKIAYWIFTFSATLSGCHPVPVLHIMDFRFNLMQKMVTCEHDALFYTPKPVKDECFTSALECIFKELEGTAAVECEDPNHQIKNGLETLKIKIEQQKEKSDIPAPTSDPECVCEAWNKTNFTVFLNNYEELLQKDYAKQDFVG